MQEGNSGVAKPTGADLGDFDFSSLYELLQDMKRSFWSIERKQERF